MLLVLVLVLAGSPATAADASRLTSELLRTASRFGLPQRRDLARKEVEKQLKKHRTELERKWKAKTKKVLEGLPAEKVRYDNSREKKASVKYMKGGTWSYRSGRDPVSSLVPGPSRGVSECWVKRSLWKRFHLGAEISHVPGTASKYYYSDQKVMRWRKYSWDSRANRWVWVTTEKRREIERDHERWNDDEMREARRKAASGPDDGQVRKAKQYADRIRETEHRRDMDAAKRASRIKSDTKMAYFRIGLALDAEIRVAALEDHRRSFRKTAWGE